MMHKKGNCKKALIIGIYSAIGKVLAEFLRVNEWTVFGTTRKKQAFEKNKYLLFLDLFQVEDFVFEERVDVVFLCAAIPKVSLCRDHPDHTRKVNVEAQLFLANYLLKKIKLLVFISTSAVFDGSIPFCSVNENTSPSTVYGQQKVEVEQELLKLGSKIAIVRLTKVLTLDYALICEWITSLSKGKVIKPFYDLLVCPVSIHLVVAVLKIIAEKQMPGIFHLSGLEEVTYADIAKYVAKQMQVSDSLVQPVSAINN